MGALAFAYGLICYVVFLVSFLYAIGFVGNFLTPTGIDMGSAEPVGRAVPVNVALLSLFAIQHSVMARIGFKRWWTRIVPASIERSTYVLLTSLILLIIFWKWQPIPELVWSISNPTARMFLHGVTAIGWGTVLVSTFLIDHFDLFGLRQVMLRLRGQPYTPLLFRATSLYRHVRHPLLLGFVIAFWSTPDMSWGHLLFAAATTGYMLIGIQLEERDLCEMHGDSYRRYRSRVPMIFPLPGKRIESIAPEDRVLEV
jgi:protein-S-isoprenylcysteine O-methyltransferase Ste14